MTEAAAPPRAPLWLRLLPLALIAALFVALIGSGALRRLSLHEPGGATAPR